MSTQHVVVYDSPKGRDIVYDTAYDAVQVRRAVRRCVAKHGSRACVRSMEARKRVLKGDY